MEPAPKVWFGEPRRWTCQFKKFLQILALTLPMTLLGTIDANYIKSKGQILNNFCDLFRSIGGVLLLFAILLQFYLSVIMAHLIDFVSRIPGFLGTYWLVSPVLHVGLLAYTLRDIFRNGYSRTRLRPYIFSVDRARACIAVGNIFITNRSASLGWQSNTSCDSMFPRGAGSTPDHRGKVRFTRAEHSGKHVQNPPSSPCCHKTNLLKAIAYRFDSLFAYKLHAYDAIDQDLHEVRIIVKFLECRIVSPGSEALKMFAEAVGLMAIRVKIQWSFEVGEFIRFNEIPDYFSKSELVKIYLIQLVPPSSTERSVIFRDLTAEIIKRIPVEHYTDWIHNAKWLIFFVYYFCINDCSVRLVSCQT